MNNNDESQRRSQRQHERAERMFENILSNGLGYTLMWIGMIHSPIVYTYLPAPFSHIAFCCVVIMFFTYDSWRPEKKLHDAAQFGNIEAFKHYLKKGGNINMRSISGHTALLIASKYANQEMISFLIDNGADINATLDTLESPLHWAVASRDPLKVELLIKKGARFNWQDNLGLTPLHWSVSRDLLEIAKILIDHGADINIHADDGKTITEIALDKQNEKMLELLKNGFPIEG